MRNAVFDAQTRGDLIFLSSLKNLSPKQIDACLDGGRDRCLQHRPSAGRRRSAPVCAGRVLTEACQACSCCFLEEHGAESAAADAQAVACGDPPNASDGGIIRLKAWGIGLLTRGATAKSCSDAGETGLGVQRLMFVYLPLVPGPGFGGYGLDGLP